MTKIYYVDRVTATLADNLEAFGLSQLLFTIVSDTSHMGLQIKDVGDSFEITLDSQLEDQLLSQINFFTLIDALETSKAHPNLEPAYYVDYIQHQRDNQAYFEARKSGLDKAELSEQGFHPPVRDWHTWAVINQMSAVSTYNKLAEFWFAHRFVFPDFLKIILNMYNYRPNDLEKNEANWKSLAQEEGLSIPSRISKLQVINPGMGKGGNRTKADGLGIGGLKGFWIPEYLKFVGLFQAGIPRVVSSKDRKIKDRKTYVLRPKVLRWETHKSVFPRFQEITYPSTAVMMDILAILRYCVIFLKQWKTGQGNGWGRFTHGQPGDHVEAFDVVFYKHLGSAHVTLNTSTLILPQWFQSIDTLEEADKYISLLDEHQGIIRNLDEQKGNEYELLLRYRDFLSARDLRSFFQFNKGYHKHVMSKMIKGKYPPKRFTTNNLEMLIMAHDKKLKPILQDEGFLHIAEGIRRSTVILQYQKRSKADPLYEVRYGLGDKLLLNSQYPDKFVQELGRFIHDYNRENARKSEARNLQYRKNITTEDIQSIVDLIDHFGAPTVANLLVAYGYARDPGIQSDTEEIES